jgi:hypothetical protein
VCVVALRHASKIARIQWVQRKFTKKLPCLAGLAHIHGLCFLEASSLKIWRLGLDLILTCKALVDLINVNAEGHFTFANSEHVPRGRSCRLLVRYNCFDVRKNCLPEHMIPAWNSLTATAADLCSLTQFSHATELSQLLYNCLQSFLLHVCVVPISALHLGVKAVESRS